MKNIDAMEKLHILAQAKEILVGLDSPVANELGAKLSLAITMELPAIANTPEGGTKAWDVFFCYYQQGMNLRETTAKVGLSYEYVRSVNGSLKAKYAITEDDLVEAFETMGAM